MIHFYVSNSLCKGAGGLKMNHIYVILISGGFKTEQKAFISKYAECIHIFKI